MILPSPTRLTSEKIVLHTHKASLEVAVRACATANILIRAPPDIQVSGYLVTIGAGNNVSRLEEMSVTGMWEIASAPTDRVLDCNRYRRFWVRWNERNIALGSGTIGSDNVLVEGMAQYTHTGLHQIELFVLPGPPAMWMLNRDEGYKAFFLQMSTIFP